MAALLEQFEKDYYSGIVVVSNNSSNRGFRFLLCRSFGLVYTIERQHEVGLVTELKHTGNKRS